MPNISADDLKAALDRALPGVRVEATPRPTEEAPRKKGEHARVDLLATDDVVILPQHIPAVASHLRDALGYEHLSNITAVDYLAEGLIEVVYHFAHVAGGVLVIKSRVSRENPELPSLTAEWPGAAFQEREAYDLYGVVFAGHPELRRIYMWDEFEGFPMRKDFSKQGDKYLDEAE